jgi:hypothetical protein
MGMSIQIGATVGDYQVIAVLGRGGMGKVFRVRSLLTLREEAMKVVSPDLEGRPELADRFLREIRVHASLEHPNIAALRAALRVDDQIVMILDLVDGVGLDEKIRTGPLDPAAAVGYISQVLSALAFAHGRGVVRTLREAGFGRTRAWDAAPLLRRSDPDIPPGARTYYLARKASSPSRLQSKAVTQPEHRHRSRH